MSLLSDGEHYGDHIVGISMHAGQCRACDDRLAQIGTLQTSCTACGAHMLIKDLVFLADEGAVCTPCMDKHFADLGFTS